MTRLSPTNLVVLLLLFVAVFCATAFAQTTILECALAQSGSEAQINNWGPCPNSADTVQCPPGATIPTLFVRCYDGTAEVELDNCQQLTTGTIVYANITGSTDKILSEDLTCETISYAITEGPTFEDATQPVNPSTCQWSRTLYCSKITTEIEVVGGIATSTIINTQAASLNECADLWQSVAGITQAKATEFASSTSTIAADSADNCSYDLQCADYNLGNSPTTYTQCTQTTLTCTDASANPQRSVKCVNTNTSTDVPLSKCIALQATLGSFASKFDFEETIDVTPQNQSVSCEFEEFIPYFGTDATFENAAPTFTAPQTCDYTRYIFCAKKQYQIEGSPTPPTVTPTITSVQLQDCTFDQADSIIVQGVDGTELSVSQNVDTCGYEFVCVFHDQQVAVVDADFTAAKCVATTTCPEGVTNPVMSIACLNTNTQQQTTTLDKCQQPAAADYINKYATAIAAASTNAKVIVAETCQNVTPAYNYHCGETTFEQTKCSPGSCFASRHVACGVTYTTRTGSVDGTPTTTPNDAINVPLEDCVTASTSTDALTQSEGDAVLAVSNAQLLGLVVVSTDCKGKCFDVADTTTPVPCPTAATQCTDFAAAPEIMVKCFELDEVTPVALGGCRINSYLDPLYIQWDPKVDVDAIAELPCSASTYNLIKCTDGTNCDANPPQCKFNRDNIGCLAREFVWEITSPNTKPQVRIVSETYLAPTECDWTTFVDLDELNAAFTASPTDTQFNTQYNNCAQEVLCADKQTTDVTELTACFNQDATKTLAWGQYSACSGAFTVESTKTRERYVYCQETDENNVTTLIDFADCNRGLDQSLFTPAVVNDILTSSSSNSYQQLDVATCAVWAYAKVFNENVAENDTISSTVAQTTPFVNGIDAMTIDTTVDCAARKISTAKYCVQTDDNNNTIIVPFAQCDSQSATPAAVVEEIPFAVTCNLQCVDAATGNYTAIQQGDSLDLANNSCVSVWTPVSGAPVCGVPYQVTQEQLCVVTFDDNNQSVFANSIACNDQTGSQTSPLFNAVESVSVTCDYSCVAADQTNKDCAVATIDDFKTVSDCDATFYTDYSCNQLYTLPGNNNTVRNPVALQDCLDFGVTEPVSVTDVAAWTAALADINYIQTYSAIDSSCAETFTTICLATAPSDTNFGTVYADEIVPCTTFTDATYTTSPNTNPEWNIDTEKYCNPTSGIVPQVASRNVYCVRQLGKINDPTTIVTTFAQTSSCQGIADIPVTVDLPCASQYTCYSPLTNQTQDCSEKTLVATTPCLETYKREVRCLVDIAGTQVVGALAECPEITTEDGFSTTEVEQYKVEADLAKTAYVFTTQVTLQCTQKCSLPGANQWEDCADLKPEIDAQDNCNVTVKYDVAFFNIDDTLFANPDSLVSISNPVANPQCIPTCTACDTQQCFVSGSSSLNGITFEFSNVAGADAVCADMDVSTCACYQKLDQAELLDYTNTTYWSSNLTTAAPSCGETVNFIIDSEVLAEEVVCQFSNGTIFGQPTDCYDSPLVLFGAIDVTYNCAVQCTACGVNTCTSSWVEDADVFPIGSGTTAIAAPCTAPHPEICDCKAQCFGGEDNITPEECVPLVHYDYKSAESNCSNIVLTIAPESYQCVYNGDNALVQGDKSCIAEESRTFIIPVDECKAVDPVCSACGAPTYSRCDATIDPELSSNPFTLPLDKCQHLVREEDCDCQRSCILNNGIAEETPLNQAFPEDTVFIPCTRPQEEMCITFKPSTYRTQVCYTGADKIRTACTVNGETSIIEPDEAPDASCTIGCYLLADALTFEDAVANNVLTPNCDIYTFRDQMVDPCADQITADIREAACVYKDENDTWQNATQCANLDEVLNAEWKSTECTAYCASIDDIEDVPTVGTSNFNITENMETCTADSFKPDNSICRYTTYDDVRVAFCAVPTAVGKTTILQSATCTSQYVGTTSFDIDATNCKTLCTAAGTTIPEQFTADDNFEFTSCEANDYRPSQCGTFTAEDAEQYRQVFCAVWDAQSQSFTTLFGKDCLLTADATTTIANTGWVGSGQCVNYCSAQVYQFGQELRVEDAQPCTEVTLPPQKGCKAEEVVRNIYCAIPSNSTGGTFVVDLENKNCFGTEIPQTQNFTYAQKEECHFDWLCPKVNGSNIFVDWVECTSPDFANFCTTCQPVNMSSIAKCIALAPTADGNIEETPGNCADLELRPCACQQVCRVDDNATWSSCVDDAAQWNEPTTCGALTTRQVALQTESTTIITDCTVNDEPCANNTFANATRFPSNTTLETTCFTQLTPVCTTPDKAESTTVSDFTSCANDAHFEPCTEENCGANKGSQRAAICLYNNDFTENFIATLQTTDDIKQAFTQAFDTQCQTTVLAEIPVVKQCLCQNAFYCSDANTPSQNFTDYASCGNNNSTYGFPACPITCIYDDRAIHRNIYCRKTTGEFIAVTAANKDECEAIEDFPADVYACAGTVQCDGQWFCQDFDATQDFTNGVIDSEYICTDDNYLSDVCYVQNANGFVEDRCITDASTGPYYRQRKVQCLLFDAENADAHTYPALPTGFTAPADHTTYCGNPAPLAQVRDLNNTCSDQEGCAPEIEAFTTTKQSIKEGENVVFNWTYIGPKQSSKTVVIEYAFAIASTPTSGLLVWKKATTTTPVPPESLGFNWIVPTFPRPVDGDALFFRAYIQPEDGAVPSYVILSTSKLALQLVETCSTITCTGSNVVTATPCAMTNDEPVCQCVQPPSGATGGTFTNINKEANQCERYSVCDALSQEQCQNGGYFEYQPNNALNSGCASSCTCPGKQTGNFCEGGCPQPDKCAVSNGRQASTQCGCSFCYRGFAGTTCNDCVRFAQIAVTKPTQDIITAFAANCPSAGCSAKNSFAQRLVDFVAQKTGYNKEFVKYDFDISVVNTTAGVQTLYNFIQFIGQCPQQQSFFIQQALPSFNNLDFSAVEQDFAQSDVFKAIATEESTTTIKPTVAVDALPADSRLDCTGADKGSSACPKIPDKPEEPEKKDSGGGATIIIAVVVAVVGVLVVAGVVIIVCCCCKSTSGDSGSGGNTKTEKTPFNKDKPPKARPMDIGNDHLELV